MTGHELATVHRVKAIHVVKTLRADLRNHLFRMEYNGEKLVMTVKQASCGAFRRPSEFIEVCW